MPENIGKDRCVFAQVSEPGFDRPKNEGENGTCNAVQGRIMSDCCFAAAAQLCLLRQRAQAEEILSGIPRTSKSNQSRRKGISNALSRHGG